MKQFVTFNDRRRIDEGMADVWPRLLRDHPNLTGRYRIMTVPDYIRSSRSGDNPIGSIMMEVHDWEGWASLEKNRLLDRALQGLNMRRRLCVAGYRGVRVGQWFYHPGYNLMAPLHSRAIKGRFHIDLDNDRRPEKWEMPHLSDDMKREFDRLGLTDHKLAMEVNREYSSIGTGSQRVMYLPFAMFSHDDEWMVAKMRFTNPNRA